MQHRELQKTKNDAARGRGLPHLHISRGYRSRGGRESAFIQCWPCLDGGQRGRRVTRAAAGGSYPNV